MKLIYLKRLSFFLILILSLSSFTYGWNKPTHMVIGAITYRELKATSPKVLERILAILKQHPYYQTQWKDEMSKYKLVEEEDLYLFMIAARWPDDVRSGEGNYHHPTWHYINYPFQPAEKQASETYSIAGETIVTAFEENLAILKSNVEDSKKAVALCWVMHLIGDVHQPLHTATYITDLYPQGDKGGNLVKIKVEENAKTINLHALWDGLILGSGNYQDILNTAIELRHRITRNTLVELKEKDFSQWAKASYELAKTKAYLNGALIGSTDDNNGALLPKGYTTSAKAVGEKQVVLSAYRLFELLIHVL
ncbi:S1/P1 nuclease [Rhodocytophaga aerolata]|uniref:S1/P1 nuclease n=1 Tax=Rhodocytophaga aerolata TaxID=455078 RepID=A0ABT8RCT4_9BACT|nr:S1/P1 nuclease [Rhodocytophaga aerolata]MDO1449516.1 S1/P1 nuclease [Rhodocytophaga aerolata]